MRKHFSKVSAQLWPVGSKKGDGRLRVEEQIAQVTLVFLTMVNGDLVGYFPTHLMLSEKKELFSTLCCQRSILCSRHIDFCVQVNYFHWRDSSFYHLSFTPNFSKFHPFSSHHSVNGDSCDIFNPHNSSGVSRRERIKTQSQHNESPQWECTQTIKKNNRRKA